MDDSSPEAISQRMKLRDCMVEAVVESSTSKIESDAEVELMSQSLQSVTSSPAEISHDAKVYPQKGLNPIQVYEAVTSLAEKIVEDVIFARISQGPCF